MCHIKAGKMKKQQPMNPLKCLCNPLNGKKHSNQKQKQQNESQA